MALDRYPSLRLHPYSLLCHPSPDTPLPSPLSIPQKLKIKNQLQKLVNKKDSFSGIYSNKHNTSRPKVKQTQFMKIGTYLARYLSQIISLLLQTSLSW